MSRSHFYSHWVASHGHPPDAAAQSAYDAARGAWNASRAAVESEVVGLQARVSHLEAALVAVADGEPVLTCPNCGAPAVAMDGSGLLVCPRDPACFCTHPSSDAGLCNICGEKADQDGTHPT